MRRTWTDLQTKIQQYTRDSDSNSQAFQNDELNAAVQFIYSELEEYISRKTDTITTVDDQQYYETPPDLARITSVTVTSGGVIYPLEPISSSKQWNRLNSVTFSGTAIPQFFFTRRDDIGIWPTPQSSSDTITIEYQYALRELSVEDYTTGTVTVTNGDETVTGSGTTFTAAMADRWFQSDDKLWYRIASFTDTENIELDKEYAGATTAGATYIIGESPEIPAELHELIPIRAAAMYYSFYRKDKAQGAFFNNMFWTGDPSMSSRDEDEAEGGLLGARKRYSGSDTSVVIKKPKPLDDLSVHVWGTTLTDS